MQPRSSDLWCVWVWVHVYVCVGGGVFAPTSHFLEGILESSLGAICRIPSLKFVLNRCL